MNQDGLFDWLKLQTALLIRCFKVHTATQGALESIPPFINNAWILVATYSRQQHLGKCLLNFDLQTSSVYHTAAANAVCEEHCQYG